MTAQGVIQDGPERVTEGVYRDTSPCAPCRGWERLGDGREHKRPDGPDLPSCRFAWTEVGHTAAGTFKVVMLCPCCGPYNLAEVKRAATAALKKEHRAD